MQSQVSACVPLRRVRHLPANFNPCAHPKGRQAQMSYTLVQSQDYDGEIVSVEVRK